MKNILIILVVSIQVLFSSCTKDFRGEGPIVTQLLDVSEFTGVSTESSIDVIISQGEFQSVAVTGYENLIDKLDLSVKNGVLKVDVKNGNYSNLNLELIIEIPTLSKLKTNGSGNITVGQFNSSNLEMNIEGSGNIVATSGLNIDNKLTSKIDGSGYIDVAGIVTSEEIKIDGSGDYNGFNLESNECNVFINGSGDAEVLVTDRLDIKVNGSGNTYYRGTPNISSTVDGSGKIIDAN